MITQSDKSLSAREPSQRGVVRFSPLVKLALGFLLGCLWSTFVFADHPVDVQRLSSEGDYFKALTMYELLPDRRLNDDARVSAAKSAWALGLTKKAASIFDAVLRSGTLDNDDRARVTLSRGIIEYQEEHYQASPKNSGSCT